MTDGDYLVVGDWGRLCGTGEVQEVAGRSSLYSRQWPPVDCSSSH